MEKQELEFQCGCSLEKIKGVLLTLGEKELRDIIAEQGKIEMKCHFCSQVYNLSPEDVENLIASSK